MREDNTVTWVSLTLFMASVLLLFLLTSCTAATLTLEKCYTACDQHMDTFEMRGNENSVNCVCQLPPVKPIPKGRVAHDPK